MLITEKQDRNGIFLGVKAFRLDRRGVLRFLFHAHNGTSVVPLNRFIEAKRRWVTDGSRQKKYRAGFHFFPEGADMTKFAALVKNKYVYVTVLAMGVEPKPRSSVGSWLARKIMVCSEDVRAARRRGAR